MENALTVLIWVVAIGIGLYIGFALFMALVGAIFFKKAKRKIDKAFDDDFFGGHGLGSPKRIRGRRMM